MQLTCISSDLQFTTPHIIIKIEGHLKNIHLHSCKHKNRKTKTNTNHNLDPNRYRRRYPDPNARIQKTEELQIKTENTNLRLRKYKRCIFLILPKIHKIHEEIGLFNIVEAIAPVTPRFQQ